MKRKKPVHIGIIPDGNRRWAQLHGMKKEEGYWVNVANQYGNELLAGLLYAPWIHEEIIKQSDTVIRKCILSPFIR